MNIQHDLLKVLLDGNYVGPVRDHLTRHPLQHRIKVLDLCTGTGKWYVTPYVFTPWPDRRCHFAGWSRWQKNSLTLNSTGSI